MYEPAGEINEVGGDFYEVFPVAGGWAVVLGDVSGKGAAAAAVTAEARHTIRTAGTLAADPVAGLHLLDEALRGRDDVALCSVAMVVLPDSRPATHRGLRLPRRAPAPDPAPRGPAPSRSASPGPLLGVVDNPTWVPTAVTIGPGDQLVLYTDGVIEARGDGRERFGSERLRDAARRLRRARARGRAGARGAAGVRRPGARRRRRPGRDPPRRHRRRPRAAARARRPAAPPRPPDGRAGRPRDDRRPTLFLVGGAATAVVSVALAGAAGAPYLALDSLSPWIVTFAIGLFCALFATPFAILARLGGELEADARWERAVLWWGASRSGCWRSPCSAGCASGFDPDTLGGAIALVAGTEAVLVLATLRRLAAQRLTAGDRLD